MPATPRFGVRYPTLSDPPNVPLDMSELAEDVERIVPKISYGTGGPPTAGMVEGDIYLQII